MTGKYNILDRNNLFDLKFLGGGGYIGTHTLVELISYLNNEFLLKSYNVLILDNLSNCEPGVFLKVNQIV